MSAYQPHPMLPADLRDYAAPTFWRQHGEKVYAAIFAALVAWAAVNETTGAGKIPASGERGQGSWSSPASTNDCPRLQDGLPLRVMVKQRTYAGFEWHECYFGRLQRRDWQ